MCRTYVFFLFCIDHFILLHYERACVFHSLCFTSHPFLCSFSISSLTPELNSSFSPTFFSSFFTFFLPLPSILRDIDTAFLLNAKIKKKFRTLIVVIFPFFTFSISLKVVVSENMIELVSENCTTTQDKTGPSRG